ncbi:MAG: hypothetical protein KKA16_06610 [Alphaproteobacteria bacterium]|nr:hypothetical protein [Alphaproteobacteria bacterium]MBU2378450.1 hypothetical protein [Alphaproteobacteria bacterium]
MKAVSRVTAIKAAIVFVAGIGSAVVLFVVSYMVFGFEWVSRGRSFDLNISWFHVAWIVLPNLLIAFFVRRWWLEQDRRVGLASAQPKTTPWLVGYLIVTSVTLFYYLQTFIGFLPT